MTDQPIHLTQSHLLRRLLQRRVERLEAEKEELRVRLDALEKQLAFSSPPEGSTPDGPQVDGALTAIRAIPARVQAEARLTHSAAQREQERLAGEVGALQGECERLWLVVSEAMEGIRAIQERSRAASGDVEAAAHLAAERLTLQLNRLNQTGAAANSAARQQAVRAVAAEAEQEAARLEGEAQAARETVLGEVAALRRETERLRAWLLSAHASARAIGEWRVAVPSVADEAPLPEPPVAPVEPSPLTPPSPEAAVLEAARAALHSNLQAAAQPPPEDKAPSSLPNPASAPFKLRSAWLSTDALHASAPPAPPFWSLITFPRPWIALVAAVSLVMLILLVTFVAA